jgi:hypothetical protein
MLVSVNDIRERPLLDRAVLHKLTSLWVWRERHINGLVYTRNWKL